MVERLCAGEFLALHRAGAQATLCSAQRFDQVDVLLLGRVAGRAFEAVPGIPLGAAHHVAEAGFFLGVVTHGALLVQGIDFEQGGVVGALAQVFGIGNGGFEGGVQVGHVSLSEGWCLPGILGGGVGPE